MSTTTNRKIDPDFITNLQNNPLKTAVNFYAARLTQSDKAIAFLKQEYSLTPEQAAKERIGFSDRRLGKTLPTTDSQLGRDLRQQLKEVGLYKSTGHEALRGCLTFPILDEHGNAIGIRGHRIDRKAKGPKEITIGVATAAKAFGNPREIEHERTEEAENANTKENALEISDNQIVFTRDNRRYRIRGLEKNNSALTLKINLMVSRDELVHVDTLDLLKSRSRISFTKAAAAELFTDAETIKRDLGTLLLKLESYQADQIEAAQSSKIKTVELTPRETEEALELLRAPNVLERIVADMDACGIVGESTNKLAGYLAATSRKLPKPLAIVIQSSTSAGKTSLMDAVLSMMPPEQVQRFSGMTGQSLFYLDSDAIKHNILAIAEDEGIREATYALKLLQSEGELRHAATARGKDGRMTTETYHVRGPVQIMLTTTAMDIDEELVNRCLVLTVDETKNQTDAIQSLQRKSFTDSANETHDQANAIRTLHQNAQRLIRPIKIYNSFAPQLKFPNHKTRLRRDHLKYLNLINTVALLHQHQRTIHQSDAGEEFIQVERSDIEIANRLCGQILGQSLDELSPQTRRLLGLINDYVTGESKSQSVSRHAFRFTRRDIRHATQWSDFQVHKHLNRLVDLEYVLAHRGKQGSRYVYELLYDGEGDTGKPFLIGLVDPRALKEPQSIRP